MALKFEQYLSGDKHNENVLGNSLHHTLIIALSAMNMDAVNIDDIQAFRQNMYTYLDIYIYTLCSF